MEIRMPIKRVHGCRFDMTTIMEIHHMEKNVIDVMIEVLNSGVIALSVKPRYASMPLVSVIMVSLIHSKM